MSNSIVLAFIHCILIQRLENRVDQRHTQFCILRTDYLLICSNIMADVLTGHEHELLISFINAPNLQGDGFYTTVRNP